MIIRQLNKVLCSLLAVTLTVTSVGAVAGETIRYVHTDHLGTPIVWTDENGNVLKTSEYEPYGLQVSGPVEDGPGYTGHVEDAATGLTYMQQRYYDPGIGMFLSVDPVTAYSSPVGQFNRYRYANGNPYRYIDPDGRSALALPLPPPLKVAQVAGAAIGTGIYIVFQDDIAAAIDSVMNESGESAEGENEPVGGGDEGGVIEIDDAKPPFTGEPGSTVRGKKQTRRYGSDGYPEVDVEGNHPGDGFDEEGEHAHDWGRPEDGGPPTHEDKGDPRPPTAEDPPSPRGFD